VTTAAPRRYQRPIASLPATARQSGQAAERIGPAWRGLRIPMANLRDRCPECTRRLVISRFDATFRLPDHSERLCFAVPGGLCEDCHQLYIDPELIDVLDLRRARCVFAIESDLVLQEQAWSSAD
jgi:hypothetical protein